MSLADYLAKNYLTADGKAEKKSKKRKRKEEGAESAGLRIADDDASGWNNDNSTNVENDGPLSVNTRSAEFRKSKKSTWQVIGTPAPSNADQAAADAILASAAAESAARAAANAAEDAPVGLQDDEDNGVLTARMESGAHAGLQTAEQVTAQIRSREAEERRRLKEEMSLDKNKADGGMASETIYRDASGRIINVAMKRAEARRKAEAEAAAQAAELEANKGDVQRREKEARQERLQEARFMTVARYADDVEMNEELKQRERWDDPMAKYIEREGAGRGSKTTGRGGGGKTGTSVTGRPLYKGPAEPNRYGIRPGHRWDGVDRGNGFEKEYFRARNRKQNVRNLEYAWQMDE